MIFPLDHHYQKTSVDRTCHSARSVITLHYGFLIHDGFIFVKLSQSLEELVLYASSKVIIYFSKGTTTTI